MANGQHPIEGLMQTAMENIKTMVDVNTILGDPVETPDGSVILPVSRVSCGFAAGGLEYETDSEGAKDSFPFGGGSGGGISVNPVAFLVVGQGQVRLLPVEGNVIYDRLIDLAPQMMDRIQGMFTNGKGTNSRVQTGIRGGLLET
ncbi:MAG: GerW family sporulation protein [Limnochordia bacterium]|jgi:sporulation protein YtfJ